MQLGMIHDEWIRNLSQKRPDLPRANHENVRRLMDEALSDAIVSGYEHLISTLNLPDPDDRHVLAAAIYSQATTIVTFNLKDFPSPALARFSIVAQHPAVFAKDLLDTYPETVIVSVRKQRMNLLNPPKTVNQFFLDLEQRSLGEFAERLKPYTDRL